MRYALIDTDGQLTIGEKHGDYLTILTELVGPEGWDRVRMAPELGAAAFVNDCGHRFPERYPRNVVGSIVLACLGCPQQPLAGPVVITGWDDSATWRDEVEIRDLSHRVDSGLRAALADIRWALGLDETRPRNSAAAEDAEWVAAIRELGEWIRTAETPTVTFTPLRQWGGA